MPLKVSFRTLFYLTVDPRELVANSFDVVGNVWMVNFVEI